MIKKTMFLFGLGLILLISAASFGLGNSPYYLLSEIKPGQRGVGYTVISGTEIKPFSVEILGLVQTESTDRTLILVRVYGAALRGINGIAAGMSGSPVFIHDRLAGAIAYAFDQADPQFGLVTPVENMLRIWERDDFQSSLALAPSPLLPPGCSTAVPVVTPLLLSGMRNPLELEQLAGRLGLRLISTGTTGSKKQTSPQLQPGSAVAAVFASGDYSAAAVGTVTWVEGQRFLAFGHPVINRGAVDYQASGAFIHRIIPSPGRPFKFGEPLDEVGRFVQDRGAGTGGVLGGKVDAVSVKAIVHDKRGGDRSFQTEVVKEPSLLKALSIAALLDAMDRTLDQYSQGTAQVALRIDAEGLQQPLVRNNAFCDRQDVAAAALSEVGEAVDLLVYNEFDQVKLESISLEVNFDPELRMATVIGARSDHDRVHPGEQVNVDVELRPYRADTRIVSFAFTVPSEIRQGRLVLTVRGGFSPGGGEDQEKQDDTALFFAGEPASLAEEIRSFVERPRNDALILEYLPVPDGPDEDLESISPISLTRECDYVVKGQAQIILEVEAPVPTEGDEVTI